jgi:iron-sulfur cluster repair protein YtfE (RIC family)
MNGPQTFSKLSQQSLDEHGLIHFYLDQLERARKSLEGATADHELLRTIAARVDSFKERLEEHFAGEEDGGLLQGIQDALPQAESDVKRIRAQHARMREALESVRSIARRAEPAEAATLESELGKLLGMIREHEREEDALVKRALKQD